MTEYEDWIRVWPMHCRKCKGAGILQWRENASPLGSGERWMMDMQEECKCILDGRCPRCGDEGNLIIREDTDLIEYLDCPACGWDSRQPDCAPPEPEEYEDGR